MSKKSRLNQNARGLPEVADDQLAETLPESSLIPPLFENSEAPAEGPSTEEVTQLPDDSPNRFSTEPEDKPAQPSPGDVQLPDLLSIRNRMADIKQDLEIVTRRTAELAGYQCPELSQACVRASEFMFWMDMSIQKAEAEAAARAAGFEVRQRQTGD